MKIVSGIDERSIVAMEKIIERLEKTLKEVPWWRFLHEKKITKEIEKFRVEIAYLKGK